ncbi:uncharacterized protein K452DRAFT_263019 [Aplosporella prunicola CBS 121167]|uniref:Peptidase S33 tripeptidyl aminopeptidase-like C-terminal domain-containing protein n=1 Tax=Aplosporella prunicola CBS 121167 TaxID=1176127 RepID=A0A6A6BRY1_9PEZI|nr:uncharacterized protein K452DRAFT_263019 [Aplosporella prunicola CBS 121167]KAF2146852.1 hypothetical protein K452DRAFT_263019 [Aplosporella prunicola CBS 121167]
MKGLPTAERPDVQPPSRARSIAKKVIILILCLYLIDVAIVKALRMARCHHDHPDFKALNFSWDTLPTKKTLDFQTCFKDLKCARVELPLDYWNGTNPDKIISLAVAVKPAKVPVTDPRYGGPIFLNPGGPGGSGTHLVIDEGSAIRSMIDSTGDPSSEAAENSTAKYYDLVGFDPRGVGKTTPGAHCFDFEPIRESWNLRRDANGILGSSDAVLGRRWAMVKALGSTCAYSAKDGDDIKQFITTASVARDMLELAELFGQWKEQETWRIMVQDAIAKRKGHESMSMQLPRLYIAGQEKLQYWGFSYGTAIGNTFAAMYPDRVGKLVLDGVVDANNYMKALWSNNLEDAEKDMQQFYDRCAESGPERCPLAKEGWTSADIKKEVDKIFADLYHNPLQVVDDDIPEIVTYSDIKTLLFMAIYSPIEHFPNIAKILAAVRDREGKDIVQRFLSPQHTFACSAKGNVTQVAPVDGEAAMAIMCSDGDAQDFLTITAFDAFWRELADISPTSGAIWAAHRLNCAGWKIRPLHRFRGPFGGDTAHPILWVGNTADPVTPLSNAHAMAKLYPGSAVLTQNSPGHCSLAAFSPCTVAHIRAYFHNGTLPAPDTVCEPVEIPFLTPTDPGNGAQALSVDEMRVAAAHAGLRRAWARTASWGLGRGVLPRGVLGLDGV